MRKGDSKKAIAEVMAVVKKLSPNSKSMKKVLLIVVLIIVIAVAVLLLQQSDNTNTQTSNNDLKPISAN